MSKPSTRILVPASQSNLLPAFNLQTCCKAGRVEAKFSLIMVPTWFLHFPVTEFLQGSWELEQASNSPHEFSSHTDLQTNNGLRTYSLFLQSSGNGHVFNCIKGFFLHFNNIQLISMVGLLWGGPGLGLWCTSVWKTAPCLSQWKLILV